MNSFYFSVSVLLLLVCFIVVSGRLYYDIMLCAGFLIINKSYFLMKTVNERFKNNIIGCITKN